jgi:hypothetical protein
VIGFSVAISIVWLMVAGFVLPVYVALGGTTAYGSWTVDSIAETMLHVPVSLLFWLVGPRLLVGWGILTGRAITWLLGRVEPRELERGVVDVLARTGEADGFRILDDLHLRFGRGPFITPVRVEATLLSLEGRGTIRAERGGRLTLYRLA